MSDTNRHRHGKRQLVVLLDLSEAELLERVAQLEQVSLSMITRRAIATYCVRAMDAWSGDPTDARDPGPARSTLPPARSSSTRSKPTSAAIPAAREVFALPNNPAAPRRKRSK